MKLKKSEDSVRQPCYYDGQVQGRHDGDGGGEGSLVHVQAEAQDQV